MLGETLNPPAAPLCPPPVTRTLPKRLLYSIFARIGGSGLDTDAFETLRASYRGGFLGKAVAYDNRQKEIPASFIHSLRWHPVRLISFLDRPYYYGAKKKYLDWIASRQLATRRYDLFHSWSGDCLRSLQVAKQLGIPSIVEIPTWHRDGGKQKIHPPDKPASTDDVSTLERWKNRLLLQRKRFVKEYDLADLLLVLSNKAAHTFSVRGFPEEKLFYLPRGVDVERFKPGKRPVWLSDHAIDAAAYWGAQKPGIVWTDHIAFGHRLSQKTGWAFFGQSGLDAAGRNIENERGDRTVIASRLANQRGRNLQYAFSRSLVMALPNAARDAEQLVGRTHRYGQTKQIVTADFLVSCTEHLNALRKLSDGAQRTRRQTGLSQKILNVDIQYHGSPPEGWAYR